MVVSGKLLASVCALSPCIVFHRLKLQEWVFVLFTFSCFYCLTERGFLTPASVCWFMIVKVDKETNGTGKLTFQSVFGSPLLFI